MNEILTVQQLTERLRGVIEGHFPFVWVRGEITNLSRPSSGHVYFSLKDSDAQLNCVWFRNSILNSRRFDPMTGEVFEDNERKDISEKLHNGQLVSCGGRIGIYAARGVYQLIVEYVQEDGVGRLAELFELAKQRLKQQGYFEAERKRPLPSCVKRVALITSPAGAAVRDFVRIAERRGTGAELRIYPTSVQGNEAHSDIIRAIKRAINDHWAQVIVLIRGGGSLEDLWAFNNESLAKEIFDSPLPVLAGIGHEIDFTLADLTADVRAATPTHAAQLLWQERIELMQKVDSLEIRLRTAIHRRISNLVQSHTYKEKMLQMASPQRQIHLQNEKCTLLEKNLAKSFRDFLAERTNALSRTENSLRLLQPRHGFEKTEEQRKMLTEKLSEIFLHYTEQAVRSHAASKRELNRAMLANIDSMRHREENLLARLQGFAPYLPLQRGFSLVRTVQGKILSSVKDAVPGEIISISLSDGNISARILPDI